MCRCKTNNNCAPACANVQRHTLATVGVGWAGGRKWPHPLKPNSDGGIPVDYTTLCLHGNDRNNTGGVPPHACGPWPFFPLPHLRPTPAHAGGPLQGPHRRPGEMRRGAVDAAIMAATTRACLSSSPPRPYRGGVGQDMYQAHDGSSPTRTKPVTAVPVDTYKARDGTRHVPGP